MMPKNWMTLKRYLRVENIYSGRYRSNIIIFNKNVCITSLIYKNVGNILYPDLGVKKTAFFFPKKITDLYCITYVCTLLYV